MSRNVEEFYDEFSVSQSDAGVHRRHIAIYQWLLKFGMKRTSDVLEIGCGVGTVTSLLARYIKQGHIIGVDVSGVSIAKAKEALAAHKHVEFIKGDIVELPLSRKFDVIVMPDVIEHIPLANHSSLFRKCSNLLKPDGFILIHIPEPHHLAWMHQHQKEYLQIIDQPIYLSELEKNLEGSGLQVTFLRNYSIWLKSYDYRVIVLKLLPDSGGYQTGRVFDSGMMKRLTNKIRSFFGRYEQIIPE